MGCDTEAAARASFADRCGAPLAGPGRVAEDRLAQFLDILPLTKAAFEPFGDVIEADPATVRLINNGTTERFHALAAVEATGAGARVIINLFRGQPCSFPYKVAMMERHPFGSQSFSPLSNRAFLVV